MGRLSFRAGVEGEESYKDASIGRTHVYSAELGRCRKARGSAGEAQRIGCFLKGTKIVTEATPESRDF